LVDFVGKFRQKPNFFLQTIAVWSIKPERRRLLLLRTTVYACEPQPITVEGLNKIVSHCEDLSLVGWSPTIDEALPFVIRQEPDVILLGPEPSFKAALDFVSAVREKTIRCQIVLWINELDEADYFKAIQTGVRGIVRKRLPVASLIECLRAVAAGSVWIDHQVSERVTGFIGRRNSPRLTPREREIVSLVCQGMKNRQISELLGITPGTVKVHLMHIFEKAGVSDRFELATQATKLFGAEVAETPKASMAMAIGMLD
jgi:DNA-binding NarL/FixJ family response regulator